jgi:two-component system, OmpR family, response regulator
LRCLVIADEPDTSRSICSGLVEAGFTVALCHDGPNGLRRAVSEIWDVVIIDRLLPDGVDGVAILGKLRGLGNAAPVLVVSALTSTDERVRALQAGGDDYLAKPLDFAELLARVHALLRRSQARELATQLKVANLTLDTRTFHVSRGPTPIFLQPGELRLLTYLMRHAGQVVTRTMLREGVWSRHFNLQNSVIDVRISRLRSKVDKGFAPPLIHTIRGVGYMLGGALP